MPTSACCPISPPKESSVPHRRPTPARKGREWLSLGIAGVVLSSPCAWADEFDLFGPLSLKFSETVTRDNNVHRLPEGASSGPNAPREDTMYDDSAGFSLDKTYGLQSLHLGATFGNRHYEHNTAQNSQTRNGDFAWRWTLTPDLTGSLTAARNESQNSFEQYGATGGSINRTDTTAASVDFGGSAPIHLIGTASHVDSSNSVAITQTGNTKALAGEIGVKYLSAAGNSIAYLLRGQRIDWQGQQLDPVNLLDTHAEQTDHEVQLHWLPTGKSSVDVVVTRLDKRYEHFHQRDYSGTGGSFSVGWQPSAQVQVALTGQRSYASWFNSFSSYSLTDNVSLRPSWQFSPKASMHMSFGRSSVEYLGPVVPQTLPLRHDHTPTAELGVDWTPLRNLALSATWHREHRDSNQIFGYSDNTGSVTARLQF